LIDGITCKENVVWRFNICSMPISNSNEKNLSVMLAVKSNISLSVAGKKISKEKYRLTLCWD
jgi:hypothetical protein